MTPPICKIVVGAGELVLLDAHDLGKNEDERNFTELGGLDAEGEEAEVQPAAVALLRVAPFEEEGDEDRAEQEQQLAPLGDDVNVDQREQDVADHTEHQRNGSAWRT